MNKLLLKFCTILAGLMLLCVSYADEVSSLCTSRYYPVSHDQITLYGAEVDSQIMLGGPKTGRWVTVELQLVERSTENNVKVNMLTDSYIPSEGAAPPTAEGYIGKESLKYSFWMDHPAYRGNPTISFVIHKAPKETSDDNAIRIITCKCGNHFP